MTPKATRNTELRSLLTARRDQLQDQADEQIRDWRIGRSTDGRDNLDNADADSQGDMEFSLAQMRAETLSRIDGALVRKKSRNPAGRALRKACGMSTYRIVPKKLWPSARAASDCPAGTERMPERRSSLK